MDVQAGRIHIQLPTKALMTDTLAQQVCNVQEDEEVGKCCSRGWCKPSSQQAQHEDLEHYHSTSTVHEQVLRSLIEKRLRAQCQGDKDLVSPSSSGNCRAKFNTDDPLTLTAYYPDLILGGFRQPQSRFMPARFARACRSVSA